MEYSSDKVRRLVNTNPILRKAYERQQKNNKNSQEDRLKAIFNGLILTSSHLSALYEKTK